MYGFVVIGGSSVGLSTARALLDHCPGAAVVVLEQEPDWARHQTDHNSGVIHSGVYYKPGILRPASLRREHGGSWSSARSTGIVGFVGVAETFAKMVVEKGGELCTGAKILQVTPRPVTT